MPLAAAISSRGGLKGGLALLLGLGACLLSAGSAQAEPFTAVASCPPPAVASAPPVEPLVACAGPEGVTLALFDHWMQVAADASSNGRATVPVPPFYSGCIAQLEARAVKKARGHGAPTSAQLKLNCERRYRILRNQVLGFLLSSAWVIDEAAALKIEVAEATVRRRFLATRREAFPKRGEFKAFLRSSGETVDDLIFRTRLNLLSIRLEKRILPNIAQFRTRWMQETYCEVGYSVAECGHVVPSL